MFVTCEASIWAVVAEGDEWIKSRYKKHLEDAI